VQQNYFGTQWDHIEFTFW